MDMSVIRNTNTKIVMRLPDRGDPELVGRAANLNDDQINELSKLPCGVAAIYQNEWVQPVLCKVERYQRKGKPYLFDSNSNSAIIKNRDSIAETLLNCIMDSELFRKGDRDDIRELKNIIIRSGLDSLVKVDLLNYIEADEEGGIPLLRRLIYDFLNAEDAIQASVQCTDIHQWVDTLVEKLDPSIKKYSRKQISLAVMLILQEKMLQDITYKPILNSFYEVYRDGGGMF